MFISCLFFLFFKSSESISITLTHFPTRNDSSRNHTPLDTPYTVHCNPLHSSKKPIQRMRSHEQSSSYMHQCSSVQQHSAHNHGQIRVYRGNDNVQQHSAHNHGQIRVYWGNDISRIFNNVFDRSRLFTTHIKDITIRLIEGSQHPSFHIMDDMFS